MILHLSAGVWLGTEFARWIARLGLDGHTLLGTSNLVNLGLLASLVVLILAVGRPRLSCALVGGLVVFIGGASEGPGSTLPIGGVELHGDRLTRGVPTVARVVNCGTWRERDFAVVTHCWMKSYRWRGKVVPTGVEVRVSLPRDLRLGPGCARMRGILRQPVAPRNQLYGSQSLLALTLSVKSTRLVIEEGCGPARDAWRAASWAVRGKIKAGLLGNTSGGGLRETDSSFGRRFAAAMWLGEPTYVPPRARVGLANWGLTHLLAVSGLHVGILLGLGLLSCQMLFPRYPKWAVGLQCLWVVSCGTCVLLAVGPRVSLTRALGMASIALLALWWRRPSGSLASLGGALGLVLLLSPSLVETVAFRLSFAATLGVVVCGPSLLKSWHRLPKAIAMPLAVTVCAQLATLPWALGFYPVIPLAAPLVNLAAIPVAGLLLVLALFVVVMHSVGLPADWLHQLLDLFGAGILRCAELEPTRWLQPSWGWHPIWSLLWAAGFFVWVSGPLRRWALAPLLAVCLWWPASKANMISFLDVGQGDAILLRSQRKGVLVDGGGWRGGQVATRVLLPVLAKERIKRLQAVVLTHGDHDHCSGLLELSWMIPIDELWIGPGRHEGSCVNALLTRFAGRTQRLTTGDQREVGDWTLAVLADGTGARTSNGRSLVLLAEQSHFAALLTGDIEAAQEETLAAWLADDRLSELKERLGSVDDLWLKVAHHGSKTSTSSRFLDAFSPSVAVISAGARNPYGHPSKVVLQRLKRRGIKALRTDILGRIDYCLPDACNQTLGSL